MRYFCAKAENVHYFHIDKGFDIMSALTQVMFDELNNEKESFHGRELYMKKKMILSVCIIFLTACIFCTIYNLDKCRAVMTGEELSFDRNTYHWVNYEKIGAYTETHHMICRTDFFGDTLCMRSENIQTISMWLSVPCGRPRYMRRIKM